MRVSGEADGRGADEAERKCFAAANQSRRGVRKYTQTRGVRKNTQTQGSEEVHTDPGG